MFIPKLFYFGIFTLIIAIYFSIKQNFILYYLFLSLTGVFLIVMDIEFSFSFFIIYVITGISLLAFMLELKDKMEIYLK